MVFRKWAFLEAVHAISIASRKLSKLTFMEIPQIPNFINFTLCPCYLNYKTIYRLQSSETPKSYKMSKERQNDTRDLLRELKQPRRRLQQERQKCAYLTTKYSS